jgi:peptide/nickel transport system substrate-binding protein
MHVAIRQVELGRFLGEARAPTKAFDMLVAGVPGDLSLSYVGAMFDGRQANGALDYANYHTPSLDSLFARVRNARSVDETREAWLALQAQLSLDVPVAWIYHSRGLQGVSARLQHVQMDLRGELATVASWRTGNSTGATPRAVTSAR